MLNRRRLTTAGLTSLLVPMTGCAAFLRNGRVERDDVGKPWSYKRIGNQERFEIRPGDHWHGEMHKERAEIGIYTFEKFRKPVWQSFSLLIETGPTFTADWNIFGQWHAYKDIWDEYVSPPIAQMMKGADMNIWTCSDAKLRQTIKAYPPEIYRKKLVNFSRGDWHHMVYNFQFDPFGKGFIKVWRNGEQILDLNDIPIGYNDMVGPYFKYGVYRAVGDKNPMAARYANMEISYDSLADRIHQPKPITGG